MSSRHVQDLISHGDVRYRPPARSHSHRRDAFESSRGSSSRRKPHSSKNSNHGTRHRTRGNVVTTAHKHVSSPDDFSYPYTKFAYMARRPKTAPIIRSELAQSFYGQKSKQVKRDRLRRAKQDLRPEGIHALQFVRNGVPRKKTPSIDMEEQDYGASDFNRHRCKYPEGAMERR